VQEAHEVEAEQEQALQRQQRHDGARGPAQLPPHGQQREQHRRGQPEAVGDRPWDRHDADLQLQRDPRGAPDQHGGEVQQGGGHAAQSAAHAPLAVAGTCAVLQRIGGPCMNPP
jgi:hypothetical protein